MKPNPVTDPDLISELEGQQPVTDPDLLRELESSGEPAGGRLEGFGRAMAPIAAADARRVPPEPDKIGDVVRSFGTGVGEGAIGTATLPGNMEMLARLVMDWGLEKAGKPGFAKSMAKFDEAMGAPTTFTSAKKAVEGVTGPFYEPQTTEGKFAKTVGEFAPLGMAMGPGGMVRRAITQVAAPGVASEAAGQYAEGTGFETPARIGAAVLAPYAVGAAGRLITPAPAISAERNQLAQELRHEGVDAATAGQRTGNRTLQYMESALGDFPGAGNKATQAQQRAGEQFTRAVLRRVGEDSPRATPEVIDRAFARIGQQFDDLAARNTLHNDPQLGHDLQAAIGDYNTMVPAAARVPFVADIVHDLYQQMGAAGALTGAQYQALRSRMDRMARGSRADPQLSGALFDIRNALDDAMARNMTPADVAAWAEARRQYRNMIPIEQAVTGAGADTAAGLISPKQLRAAVVNLNRRAYGRGEGDLADLARAGTGILENLPQSGTMPRTAVAAIPAALAGAAGVGAAGGNPAGAAAAVAGPALAGRAVMSGPVQAYLGNQLLAGPLRALEPAAAAQVNAASSLPETEAGRRLERNQTYQALVRGGIPPQEAAAAIGKPDKLRELLGRIRGAGAR